MKHIALFVLISLLATAAAQEGPAPEAKGPQMDAVSKPVIEGWNKKLYTLGTAGVKKCSFTINATLSGPGQVMKGVGKYKYDGKKGSLSWDNPLLGGQLAQQGWSAEMFDEQFKTNSVLEALGNAKLRGEKTENGTIVHIDGAPVKSGMQWKRMIFDKDGVNRRVAISAPNQMGGQMEMEFTLTYQKVGDKWINDGWAFETEFPGVGKYAESCTVTMVEVNGFHVGSKARSVGKSQMGEVVKELVFTDYKFNDDVE